MNGRMEIREILGMLGTLAALSLAANALQTVGADAAQGRDLPVEVREAPVEVHVAPPDTSPELPVDEARLVRPEMTPPPLRCPPLPEPWMRERLPGCGTVLA
ncbi:MAG: hypothetical protein R6X22_00335 [Gemmatimonadota bacterium]|jgi:hypothetical protein